VDNVNILIGLSMLDLVKIHNKIKNFSINPVNCKLVYSYKMNL